MPMLWLKQMSNEQCLFTDPVDLFNLFGICGHPSPAFHGLKDRRSRNHHFPLLVRFGILQGSLHSKLDVPLLLGGLLWLDCNHCWHCTNCIVLWLLLFIHYQRRVSLIFIIFNVSYFSWQLFIDIFWTPYIT